MKQLRAVILVAVLGLLAACGKGVKPEDEQAGQAVPPTSEDTHGIGTPGASSGTALTPEEQARLEQEKLLGQFTIYFDYDTAEIRPEYVKLVQAHAQDLARNPARAVRLEGHADERGSREYNIALGERRAQAVRQALQLQGVAASQLSTVSYGEEKPVALGHDEPSWWQNRRVVLVYTN